jgi:hypothetical protein
MNLFQLNIASVILRFYLMMAVVIGSIFAGQMWLSVLALPIFLSIMLGISFKRPVVSGKVVSQQQVVRAQAA